jgi:predicted nucleotidyltransferase
MKNIEEMQGDLSFAKDYEVIIFGSYASKTADKRSDIDIAIISREHDRQKCIEIWKETFGKAPNVYDIKIFELLPLRIKASAMRKFEVVFGNRLDISEYFYVYRKLWNDVKHRIETNRFSSMREKLMLLKRRQKSYEKHI